MKQDALPIDGIDTSVSNMVQSIPSQEEKPFPLTAKSRNRILVVDDNVNAAKTMGWMLELILGQEVCVAYDGPSALTIAKTWHPDLILLDISLAEMSGYDVCRALRQEPALENIMIVAQTGWGQEEHRQRSKEAGFDDHLLKPIALEKLQDVLDVLESRSLAKSAVVA